MRYVFGLVLICNALMLLSQESVTVYDTSFYSQDSSYVLLAPGYVDGEVYTYEVSNNNLHVEDGDTIRNKNSVNQFSFRQENVDSEGIAIELFLEDDYWKKIIMFDSLYSSWTNDSIPEIHLKYIQSENNFSLGDYKPVSDYIQKYITEAKHYFDNDSLADEWDIKIANSCLDKSRDSTVVRNWLTFSGGPWTLFTYYSFMFPENEEVRYELSQKREEFGVSTFYLITRENLKDGNSKFRIREDESRGKNSSDRMFDQMVEMFSDIDTSYNLNNYKSETDDETYVIVDPNGIIVEATTKSYDRAVMKNVVSESKSIYTVRLVE